MKPLVTICLPNLNTRPFLEERMQTLLSQTMADWELIISDNHSDDGAWEYLQQFRGDRRISLNQAPRRGMYSNWNECLRRARGEYIYFATSDDTASPNLLEQLLQPLERHPSIHVSTCDWQAIDAGSQPLPMHEGGLRRFLGRWLEVPHIKDGKAVFLINACFYGPIWSTMTSVLFRRSLLERTGFFREDRGSFADCEWAMRAALASDIAYWPEKLATWRIHDKQATPSVMTPAMVEAGVDFLNTVLSDPRAGVPHEWTKSDGWKDRINAVIRERRRRSFNLYRWAARSNPRNFLSGIAASFRHEPSWLLRQTLNGFAWEPELDIDSACRDLLQFFQVKWPPEQIARR